MIDRRWLWNDQNNSSNNNNGKDFHIYIIPGTTLEIIFTDKQSKQKLCLKKRKWDGLELNITRYP